MMTEQEWQDILQTYTTPEEVVKETLIGLEDQLRPCTKGQTKWVPGGPTGISKRPATCDRGTAGCGSKHNDGQALRFACMALKRTEGLLESAVSA